MDIDPDKVAVVTSWDNDNQKGVAITMGARRWRYELDFESLTDGLRATCIGYQGTNRYPINYARLHVKKWERAEGGIARLVEARDVTPDDLVPYEGWTPKNERNLASSLCFPGDPTNRSSYKALTHQYSVQGYKALGRIDQGGRRWTYMYRRHGAGVISLLRTLFQDECDEGTLLPPGFWTTSSGVLYAFVRRIGDESLGLIKGNLDALGLDAQVRRIRLVRANTTQAIAVTVMNGQLTLVKKRALLDYHGIVRSQEDTWTPRVPEEISWLHESQETYDARMPLFPEDVAEIVSEIRWTHAQTQLLDKALYARFLHALARHGQGRVYAFHPYVGMINPPQTDAEAMTHAINTIGLPRPMLYA